MLLVVFQACLQDFLERCLCWSLGICLLMKSERWGDLGAYDKRKWHP